jgi:arylsulfatase A-like enzyme
MRPNFLFIIVDDLNAWIGALGRHPQVKTPNIDALARRGALFTNAYCSAPYCNASRMGLYTGCLPSTLGVYANEPFWDAANRRPTIMELLRDNGYRTAGAGKVFHGIFDYEKAGYDRLDHAPWKEIETRDLAWHEFRQNVSEPLPAGRPLNGLFDFSDFASVPEMYRHFDWGPIPDEREQEMPDFQVVASVKQFLGSAPSEPFFCAAGLYKPHLPWHAPKRFFDLYPGDISLPIVKDDDLDDVPPLAREWALTPPDHELVTSRGAWKDGVRGYLACISYADFLVGELIAALDASPSAGNTAIILCGDNGFHLGEKLHWRKFALWEEATRVPLIYVPPGGLAAPSRPATPVSLIDIFPTVLEAAGVPFASAIDAESLLNQATGKSAEPRSKPVITTWGEGNHSVRTQRWRYTRYTDGGEELYDHAADPHEWTNLALSSGFSSVCSELKAAIDGQVRALPVS